MAINLGMERSLKNADVKDHIAESADRRFPNLLLQQFTPLMTDSISARSQIVAIRE